MTKRSVDGTNWPILERNFGPVGDVHCALGCSIPISSTRYAEAAREGAPQARQVADRFHLLQNFRETVERQLGRYKAQVPEARINLDDGQANCRFRRSRIVAPTWRSKNA